MKATDTPGNSSHCSSVNTTSENSHIILFFSSHIFRTKADWNLPREMVNAGQTLKTQLLMSDARQTHQVSLG